MDDTSAEGPSDHRDHSDPDLLDDGLRDLLDDHRHSEAVAERRRAHWLRRQAEESGSLHGVLVDLCERGAAVTIRTRSAHARQGTIEAVGADFVRLRSPDGIAVLVVTAAITQLRAEPGSATTAGDRVPAEALGTLVDLFATLVADRRALTVTTHDGGRVRGHLQALGTDVLTLAWGPGTTVYVALDAVSDVVLA